MKNIQYILLICLSITTTVFSQSIIKPIENALPDTEYSNANTYYKDTNNKLQNCVGTWVFEDATNYFMVTFTKEKIKVNDTYNVYWDVLKAKFYYSKNDVVVYDNLNATPEAGANSKPSEIQSDFVKNGNISFAYFEPSFTECHRRKYGYLSINIISGRATPKKMNWEMEVYEGSPDNERCENGAPIDDSPFLIPANMVLVKQP